MPVAVVRPFALCHRSVIGQAVGWSVSREADDEAHNSGSKSPLLHRRPAQSRKCPGLAKLFAMVGGGGLGGYMPIPFARPGYGREVWHIAAVLRLHHSYAPAEVHEDWLAYCLYF